MLNIQSPPEVSWDDFASENLEGKLTKEPLVLHDSRHVHAGLMQAPTPGDTTVIQQEINAV